MLNRKALCRVLGWFWSGLAGGLLAASASMAGEEAKEAPQEAPKPEVKLPAKEKFHLFLLIGQSNMAGRGKVEAGDKEGEVHPRVWMLDKDNKWVPAKDPIHFDRSNAGVGPGLSFAKAVAEKDPDVHVGLIPCAVGGTALGAWLPPKSGLFKSAVTRANKAMEAGTLKGILWHQGESNTVEGKWDKAGYEAGMIKMVAGFREELKSPEVPFVAGELGRWFGKKGGADELNALLGSLGGKIGRFGCAGTEELKSMEGLHFDAPSQRKLGRRYAEVYLKLLEADKKPAAPPGKKPASEPPGKP